jgi:Cd2+/Zn2+-exporting ATPase
MAHDLLELELAALLPDEADGCRRCVGALLRDLSKQPGVTSADVSEGEGGREAVCIRFDRGTTSAEELEQVARQATAALDARYGHFSLPVGGGAHASAAEQIVGRLRDEPGVSDAVVGADGHSFVEYDRQATDEARLRAAIQTVGIVFASSEPAELQTAPPAPGPPPPEAKHASPETEAPPPADVGEGHLHGSGEHEHAHGGVFGERTELIFAVLAGVMLGAGWLADRTVQGVLPIACYLVAYGFGGFFTLKEALDNLRHRRFEIDTLMLVAAVGAATLGQWAEGALLLFLFSLGHALEHYAMGRARRAIEALAKLAPETATVRRGESTQDIPVAELRVGDVILVRPNERIAADGVVTLGKSSVNQAPVTGESVPVDKTPAADSQLDFAKASAEQRVYAGTINGAGALDVRVARKASETTLARVVKMVAEAEGQRSPTQNFTDRFEKIFVPTVLAGVGLLMLAWMVIDEPFSASFYRAMAVLVAASPCALAISVPSAVLSGVARAGRGGVLVKGGGPLENLGTLTALAFDKTGTLTEGKPQLTDVVPAEGIDERDLLAVAVAVERLSDHPLAAAVVRDGSAKLGDHPEPAAEAVESLTGQGVRARVAGQATVIGKPALFESGDGTHLSEIIWSDARRLESSGRTVMVVRQGDRYLGVLGLMDTARPGAKAVIQRLRALGITRMIMLSGDNQSVADAIAKELGLDEAKGGLMPEDKVEVIKALRAKAGKVAMVGDGVNDAPAMANATVGIAMGAAGSDVALETADVALMADDLSHLPFAVGLSRRTSGIIKQNLWVSLGMVAFLIPATLLGLKIGAAVIFHEGSTLLVVGNALRLLAYKAKTT